jgi:hemerythrin
MAIQDAPSQPPVLGIAEIDAEHALQYKLLEEVERVLERGDVAAARVVVKQLHEYSEAHFGSEQIIMRLHSYPGYNAHEREHGDLLAALQRLSVGLEVETGMASAAAIRRWLTTHIHHADQAFIDYLNNR